MLRTACLVDYTCYTLFIRYVTRGIFKVRNTSWLNDLYGEDNVSRVGVHQYPHIRIEFIGLPKRCAMIVLLIYKLMLTHFFTNNLYGLPYRPYPPGSDVAYP